MKRNVLKITGSLALAVLVIFVLTTNLTFAQEKSADQNIENLRNGNGFGGDIVGAWDVVVTIRNCGTDAAIRTFPAVTMFNFGGTMIDASGGVPSALRSPGLGVWKNLWGNTYSFSYKAFDFDTNNVLTGWTIIRQHITLYGDLYFSRGTAEVYNVNGNLLSTRCATTTGRRFE